MKSISNIFVLRLLYCMAFRYGLKVSILEDRMEEAFIQWELQQKKIKAALKFSPICSGQLQDGQWNTHETQDEVRNISILG